MRHKPQLFTLEKCWVGETQKICYGSETEAETVARIVESDYGLPPKSLGFYRCEYGDHWHLTNV